MAIPRETIRLHESVAVEAVEALLSAAESEAKRHAYESVVEVSDRSESVYLHVRRGSVWFGFRIACHEPFYACSADYAQMIIPRVVAASDLTHYEGFLRQAIQVGGKVVADPAEVEAMIVREERRLEDLAKRPRLSALAKCDIRHRLNFVALWAEELRGQDLRAEP